MSLTAEREKEIRGKSYKVDNGPIITELFAEIDELREVNARLLSAVKANHKWHQEYDYYDGYLDSDLYEVNTEAIFIGGSHERKKELFTPE